MLIPGPSCGHGNGQTTPLPLSIRPKMLRPKILRPKYSFILSSGTGPVNLRLPQGRICKKAVIARSDHSLQHSYSLIDCQIFRNEGCTTTLLDVEAEASGTSVGCNNHHSVRTHYPLNRNRASPALAYNPSNKCAMRVFPRSQENLPPQFQRSTHIESINIFYIQQYIAFVNKNVSIPLACMDRIFSSIS